MLIPVLEYCSTINLQVIANVTPSDKSGVTLDPCVEYNIDEDPTTANTVFVIKHVGNIPENLFNAAQGTLIRTSASYTGTTKAAVHAQLKQVTSTRCYCCSK